MQRKETIDFIFNIAKEKNAFELLEIHFLAVEDSKIPQLILECGVMPELFGHDSSEEKLWAKYSDIILARAFSLLGLKSQVIRMRGNSADVLAEAEKYKIVGDAKTFRLSRTAKNQKDFKVESLNSWRRQNDYAVLVGPLNQFPSTNSAIYKQAIEKNVTLLSYAHLHFMISHKQNNQDIEPLWNTGYSLQKTSSNFRSASNYWDAIDLLTLQISDNSTQDLIQVKKLDRIIIQELGREGIEYWENKMGEYRSLSKEQAIQLLLKAEKIESKIEQIRKAINREVAE